MCPVGLLPAAVCGIDIKGMLEGAAAMQDRCTSTDMWKNPALMQAVVMYLAMTEIEANITVMMPYADSMKYMADWYCQLWAESLGKAHTRDGKLINAGSTPVKSLGVTDQHSQLQLYTEGPVDKVVTFLAVDDYRAIKIPEGCEYVPARRLPRWTDPQSADPGRTARHRVRPFQGRPHDARRSRCPR